MTGRPWWLIAIQWILWLIAMLAVTRWLERSRHSIQPENGCLVHPPSTLVLGGIGFNFFVSITILSNGYSNETTTWWTTTAFIVVAFLFGWIMVRYFVEKHEVSETGLVFTSVFGKRKSMRWDEVKSVRYSFGMQWFIVESASGDSARISAMLIGLPEFARLVLLRVPASSFSSFTRMLLQKTADGDPPPLWM